jgi:hypothetical protein
VNILKTATLFVQTLFESSKHNDLFFEKNSFFFVNIFQLEVIYRLGIILCHMNNANVI